ncbi:unnamed protein product [Nesidiocoris tenuis]|uniref:Uncharacterized protein n=1 Tax=Nesidiocoris tenuis TaxID=355587 RepID=A0A6H5HRC3_9HEMI|nr:unnamed protein product [Nesidiocoris tenuis]
MIVRLFSAERKGFQIGRGRRPAPFPQGLGPFPILAPEDPDGRRFRGHTDVAVRRGETAEPAPVDQGRDRQLHRRLHQDDGVRRTYHCGKSRIHHIVKERFVKPVFILVNFWEIII